MGFPSLGSCAKPARNVETEERGSWGGQRGCLPGLHKVASKTLCHSDSEATWPDCSTWLMVAQGTKALWVAFYILMLGAPGGARWLSSRQGVGTGRRAGKWILGSPGWIPSLLWHCLPARRVCASLLPPPWGSLVGQTCWGRPDIWEVTFNTGTS